MTMLATVDGRERVRATRVEVARLQTLGYRIELTEWQKTMVLQLVQRHMTTLPLADRESIVNADLDRDSTMDWSVVDEPGVMRALAFAVRAVVARYGDKLSATVDDLTQCGRIILAERSHEARLRHAKGGLELWLRHQLRDLVRHEHRDSSLDALMESEDVAL